MAQPDDFSMRVSDAEREAVAERLRVALDEGRITLVEYDDRLRAAYAAAVRADLVPLTGDLPEPAAPSAEVAKQDRNRRKVRKEWRDWAGTSFVLVGIWAVISVATGELIAFWPIFPVGIWAVFLVAGMLFGFDGDCGGEPDDDSGDGRDVRRQ